MTIPKYCALLIDDEESISNCGTGDTPNAALKDYMDNGDFENDCQYCCFNPGDNVEVYIYSVIDIENSDWPEEAREANWQWCLDRKIDTRIVEAV